GGSGQAARRAGLLGPRVGWVRAGDDPGARWMAPLGLLGAHGRRNALIARACLRGLGVPEASDDAALERAAAGFAPLAHRLQVIGEVGGGELAEDRPSPNQPPTLRPLGALPRRPGPASPGPQRPRAPPAPAPPPAPGAAAGGPRSGGGWGGAGPAKVDVVACDGLDEAVERGFGWARPDGVVLLSPAAPSFGRFRDYADRGAAFARAMHARLSSL